jgi:hypothetical protein
LDGKSTSINDDVERLNRDFSTFFTTLRDQDREIELLKSDKKSFQDYTQSMLERIKLDVD